MSFTTNTYSTYTNSDFIWIPNTRHNSICYMACFAVQNILDPTYTDKIHLSTLFHIHARFCFTFSNSKKEQCQPLQNEPAFYCKLLYLLHLYTLSSYSPFFSFFFFFWVLCDMWTWQPQEWARSCWKQSSKQNQQMGERKFYKSKWYFYSVIFCI